MANLFKKFIDGLKIGITMILGYVVMVHIFWVLIAVSIFVLFWLILETFSNPALFLPIDILVIIGLGYLVTRKRVKAGFREFWNQVKGNM